MKKFFIFLIVVIILAGLTFSSFAGKQKARKGDCDQTCVPVCEVCPNPDCPKTDCEPKEYDYKGSKWDSE